MEIEETGSMWDCLPDVILQDVFSRLSMSDRYSASQVCRNWYRVFYAPKVWSTFVMGDLILTRRKYNYYTGYQHILDHYRTQMCLDRVGRCFRRLILPPMSNFFNLYEFMSMMSYYSEFFDDNPLRHIRSLHYTFACHLATGDANQEYVFGTGGRLLQALKRLMKNLTGLRHLYLQDLLLDRNEAMYLLDDVVNNCHDTLRSLRLVNCTREPYPIFHAGVFLNIKTMALSPQQLNDDVVMLLGHTTLRDLHLVQNKYTENVTSVSRRAWREVQKASPKLRIHLLIEGKVKKEVVWQDGAPVKSISYDSPYCQVTPQSVLVASSLYCNDLEVYGFTRLPRFHMSSSFMERCDASLVLLCRACPKLNTLVVRELVSTATVLLLAVSRPCLQRLIVRKNAMIKKCDWPPNPDWSDEFYAWLRHSSHSYDRTAEEVSKILGYNWAPMVDQDFKKVILP